ncbi:MAG TPA: 50S ribosomal protein L23 [Gemmataceae bacterium]|nr:50S ribosomal protein L23 [Gemmataceae bacterium]
MAGTNHPARRKGPKLEPYQVILRPLVTEKGTHLSQHHSEKRKVFTPAYSFEVNQWATKTEIRHAAEELFGVHVKKVNTQNRIGKRRRYRFKMGKLPDWKKAIITLTADSPPIEFY